MRRAVFLDRDGVLNRAVVRDGKPYPPATPEELEIVPEAPEALARLKASGFLLVVVTNQPDVSRGTQTREVVEAIHERLRAALPIDDVRTCYHDDHDGCDCRKPKPGLLLKAAAEFGLELEASFMVGDRWRDIDAGAAAGCRTIYIDLGYRERGPSKPANYRAKDLCETVGWILQQSGGVHEKAG